MKCAKDIAIILLTLFALASMKQCSENDNAARRWMDNYEVVMDTVIRQREANGKVFSENRALRLTADELRKSNTQLSKEVEDATKKLKRALSYTSIRVEHDTIEVEVRVKPDNSFEHTDSCIYIAYSDSTIQYTIAPIIVQISQYREGENVIAAATAIGCGQVRSISSLYIEPDKKKWWEQGWVWGLVGFGLGLGVR